MQDISRAENSSLLTTALATTGFHYQHVCAPTITALCPVAPGEQLGPAHCWVEAMALAPRQVPGQGVAAAVAAAGAEGPDLLPAHW